MSRIEVDSFTGLWLSAKYSFAKPFTLVQERAVFRANFEESLLHLGRVRMIVIIIAQAKLAIGTKAEEALNRLQVFGRKVINLRAQLQQHDRAGACSVDQQDSCQNRYIPECKPCAHMFGPKVFHSASALSTNPTPRTVRRS